MVTFFQPSGEKSTEEFPHRDSVVSLLKHIKQDIFDVHRRRVIPEIDDR